MTGVPVNTCCGGWGVSLESRDRTGPHEGDQSWVSGQGRTGPHEGDLTGTGRGRDRVSGSLEQLLGVSLQYTLF